MKQREESQWFLALWLEQLVDQGVVYQDREEKEAIVPLGRNHEFSFGSIGLEVFKGWA